MNKKIMVVDDDEGYTRMLQVGLQQGGYDVTVVHNGRDALAQVAQDAPHLILLDHEMPDLHGLEVLRQLQRDRATMRIPVLMLTGKGDIPDVAKSLHAGAVFHLTKPFTVTELLSLLKNFPL